MSCRVGPCRFRGAPTEHPSWVVFVFESSAYAWKGSLVATWGQLVAFIRQSYEIVGDEPDEVRILLRYNADDDDNQPARTQMVVVAREILDRREDWVQIASPFARVRDVDLRAVLIEVGRSTVVGGVAIIGDYVVLRHSLPLTNLDINEFVDPLLLVTGSAELLEQKFIGHDNF
jgi:hypothetical protein